MPAADVTPAVAGGETHPLPRPTRRRQLALAALSGVLYVLSFPGIDQFYLAFFAFVPLLLAAEKATVRRAVFLGAVAGFVSHLGGYYWVVHLLQEFAMLPLPAAVLGWLLVCVGQGASFGVGLGLSQWLRRRTGWPLALTLAIGLTAMDFLYPLLFPSYVANTMAGALWVMQLAELGGVLAITALLGAINGVLADAWLAWRGRRPLPARGLTVVGAVFAAVLAFGAVRVAQVDATAAAAPQLEVGIVQANVGGARRHLQPGESLRRHVQMTRELSARGVDLVVWPEGAYQGVVRGDTDVRRDILGGTSQALLFGGARIDVDRTGVVLPFNSAFLSDAQGRIRGYYDKTVLLAFGEYVPGGDWFPQIYEMLPYSSRFGRGTTTAPLELDGWKLGTYICYEDIIPRFVQRIMAPRDGERPDVMVNVTNDSWYGDTTEPPIHLALARFRSVEHRRALVRSTNTGISAFVDPAGRVTAKTRTYSQETLVSSVPKMAGSTVYQHVGDAAGFLALGMLGLGFVLGRRRR